MFHAWVAEVAPKLCAPGRGRTWERFVALGEAAGRDLALGRLGEGHADAIAILSEAACARVGAGPYGVWAARGATGEVKATPTADGWRLDGRKGFCSGVGMVGRALVTAEAPDGTRLFDLDVTTNQVRPEPGSWPSVGMAASASASVVFDGIGVTAAHCVGPPGFYTGRIGFWWGAAGVAACWWGGAQALLETVGRSLQAGSAGDHELAAYGVAMARSRSMTETLRWAATEIDTGGDDVDRARRTALTVREVVHDACTTILASAAAAGGARPICLDVSQSQRSADLYAYLAQHHGGRDAAALGADLLRAP
jgi:alkylation response protein AidB-like acyl-CoA dehydrogenase